jgi:hypothetical protein
MKAYVMTSIAVIGFALILMGGFPQIAAADQDMGTDNTSSYSQDMATPGTDTGYGSSRVQGPGDDVTMIPDNEYDNMQVAPDQYGTNQVAPDTGYGTQITPDQSGTAGVAPDWYGTNRVTPDTGYGTTDQNNPSLNQNDQSFNTPQDDNSKLVPRTYGENDTQEGYGSMDDESQGYGSSESGLSTGTWKGEGGLGGYGEGDQSGNDVTY